MVGVSKAGITGLSILSIALFNHVFPSSKQASGLVLPLLIFGDFVAVFAYRKHTQWQLSVALVSMDRGRRRDGLLHARPHFRSHRADFHRLDHRLAGGFELLAQVRVGTRR